MSKFSLAFWNGSEAGDRVLVVGKQWWYDESLQGAESNVYDTAIPVADIVRRLFHWEPESLPVYVAVPAGPEDFTAFDPAGNMVRFQMVADRQAIASDDTHEVLGMFKLGYQAHSYKTWLLGNIANLLGGEVGIYSAGFANRERSQAFVSVRSPETVSTPEGVDFLPNLLAYTSLDGSLATTYKRCATLPVCDNTFGMAVAEGKGQTVRVKHTRYSHLKLQDAQQTLGLLHEVAEDFSAAVKSLCEWEVTDTQFSRLLDKMIDRGESTRSQNMADKRRAGIASLYRHDERAATWKGTAFGVLQAFDTYDRHMATVRGVSRPERMIAGTIDGSYDKGAQEVLKVLATV